MMRVLVVDDGFRNKSLVSEFLTPGLRAAYERSVLAGSTPPDPFSVKLWPPSLRGIPEEGKDGFIWNYDVILINVALKEDTVPLLWLEQARHTAIEDRWPSVVMLMKDKDAVELLSPKANALGVVSYLLQDELVPVELYSQVQQAAQAFHDRQIERDSRLLSKGSPFSQLKIPPVLPLVEGYQVERLLGVGGTSRVYLAKRNSDEQELVLKILTPHLVYNNTALQRFIQEFRLVQMIKSDHVTKVFDSYHQGELAYIAMEYFIGGDLEHKAKSKILHPIEALRLFGQIAKALQAIHDAGIIHRDLKPQNIMFRNDKEVAIADFGGAKHLLENHDITQMGNTIGTPNYMSPEQIRGKDVDHRSDLYNLGVMLYFMLTGRPLYRANTMLDLMHMHLDAPIPMLPEELMGFGTLLNKLVAKKPEDRFQSASELYRYLP